MKNIVQNPKSPIHLKFIRAFAGLGCLLMLFITSCSKAADSIHGSWHNAASDVTIIFSPDGTVDSTAVLGGGMFKGKFKILSDKKIKLISKGVIYGENENILDYTLRGTTLELNFGGSVTVWKRQ